MKKLSVMNKVFEINKQIKEIPENTGEISDGYHTFDELYDYRREYNAALFNVLATDSKYNVHKSHLHSDGEEPFGEVGLL